MAVVADSCMTWYTLLIYCRPPADGTFSEIWTVIIIVIIVIIIIVIVKVILSITIVRMTMMIMML